MISQRKLVLSQVLIWGAAIASPIAIFTFHDLEGTNHGSFIPWAIHVGVVFGSTFLIVITGNVTAVCLIRHHEVKEDSEQFSQSKRMTKRAMTTVMLNLLATLFVEVWPLLLVILF